MPIKDIHGFDQNEDAVPPKPAGNNYLLAIAIDDYQHVPKLSNCVKDAKGLIAVLKERYNFLAKNITTVFNTDASLEQINRKLDELSSKVRENDNVIIYFSGHGYHKASQKEGYLIPVEGKPNSYWTYLSNSNLLNHIRAINSFHTFLIVDSCFSGSLFAKRDVDGFAYASKIGNYRSRWGLAAGMVERVDDGYHGDNSPFAKAVISFLKNNGNEKSSVSDLIQYVKKATASNAKQTPIGGHLFKVGDMAGEFVFEVHKDLEAAFEKAKLSRNRKVLITFLTTSTNLVQKKIIRNILKEVETDEIWRQVNKRSYADLDGFVDDYPRHPKVNEARALMSKLGISEEPGPTTPKPLSETSAPPTVKPTPTVDSPKPAEKQQKKKEAPKKKVEKVITPSAHIVNTTGTFTDPRDGQAYKTVKLKDGKIWLAQNLNFRTLQVEVKAGFIFKTNRKVNSWYYYGDNQKNGDKFGKLYIWDAAALACPKGWHLPSDKEWKKMIACYGGLGQESYKALIEGGIVGFSALLGGRRRADGSYSNLGVYGRYWSSTEHRNSESVWGYNFYKPQTKIIRHYGYEKNLAFSVRCIKD